ncbi:MAG TPA: sugar phosphorylase [Methylomirabilota bacterium]|nr:sugar phosphorylase [Methylomirabilota bacterium]
MRDTWRGHMEFLYGAERASTAGAGLDRLVEEHLGALEREDPSGANRGEGPPGGAGAAGELTEKDMMLIAYGDQVTVAGEPPLRTLETFARSQLKEIVSAIHVLPFYPYSSDDGFSVIDYKAVDPRLGDWEDVRRLASEFDLMFDAVFNHVSARSAWFEGFLRDDPVFRDFFVTVEGEPDLSRVARPRVSPLVTPFATAAGRRRVWTTFSADQVDLDVRNPEVLLALLDVLLFYVRRGARFIRLDAIAFLWKEIGTSCIHLPQTHRIIQLMRAVLDEVAPGVRLITETNVPHRDNVSYFGDGTNEAQLVYNFALPPLVLHAMSEGNAEVLTRWAEELEVPSPRVAFFNFLASHDGIGLNPARGILSEKEIAKLAERAVRHGGYVSNKSNPDGSRSPYELNVTWLDALSDPAAEPESVRVDRLVVSHAILLSLAGVPGIYFHSLVGSGNDRAGTEESGMPRRINRERLGLAGLMSELGEAGHLRQRVFERLAGWMRLRRSEPAFHPAAGQRILRVDSRVFGLMRTAVGGGERVVCLHNVSGERVVVWLPDEALAGAASIVELRRGTGVGRRVLAGAEVELEPYGILWARLE